MTMPSWYEWDEENGILKFYGIKSVLFWQIPSLSTIIRPVIEQLGESFYCLLVAYEASKGTKEDYNNMITQLGGNFEEGLTNWGKAVETAGWGKLFVKRIDWNTKKACIALENPWELNIFRAKDVEYNLPFMCGKLSGIFTYAFKENSRARVVEIVSTSKKNQVIIEVSTSSETLKSELETLNRKEGVTRFEKLQILNKELKQTKIELEYLNKKLIKLATTDELTGLNNRRSFTSQAEKAVVYANRYNMPLCIIMMDIDKFKKINDTYGHKAGDETLKRFADIFKNNLRSSDIFGRVGGEEFSVLLPGIDISQAESIVEKIRKATSELVIKDNDKTISFTVSLGLTSLSLDETFEEVLRRADKALYQAKKEGRNRYVVLLKST